MNLVFALWSERSAVKRWSLSFIFIMWTSISCLAPYFEWQFTVLSSNEKMSLHENLPYFMLRSKDCFPSELWGDYFSFWCSFLFFKLACWPVWDYEHLLLFITQRQHLREWTFSCRTIFQIIFRRFFLYLFLSPDKHLVCWLSHTVNITIKTSQSAYKAK